MTPEPTTVVDREEETDATVAMPPPERPVVEPDNGSLNGLLTFVGAMLALGFLQSWWIPGIVAGLLFILFMHELGHYVTARLSGMKVTEFFLGFGPKIWSFQRGETEYGVKGIPAGAYVRIIGMTNLEDIDPAEEHRTYRAQPYWQRMITICAGSAMHFMMAIVALVVLFAAYDYGGFNGPPWEVREVTVGSTAENIGVEVGDTILEVNGEAFDTWEGFGAIVRDLTVAPVDVLVERDGDTIELAGVMGARSGDVVGKGFGLVVNEDIDSQGWRVSRVSAASNAADLGFEVGDAVLAAGDIVRPSQSALATLLIATDGGPIDFTVDRDGAEQQISGPVLLDRSSEFRGFFGIGPRYRDVEPVGVVESIPLAVEDFGLVVSANLQSLADVPASLGGLLSPDSEPVDSGVTTTGSGEPAGDDNCGASENRLLSIIGVGRLIACSESAAQVFFLFAIVNTFVGLFNLLPLLPLDGGHAAIATYERGRELITRKPHRVDAAKLIPITWAVMSVLIVIGLWTMFLDIFSWS